MSDEINGSEPEQTIAQRMLAGEQERRAAHDKYISEHETVEQLRESLRQLTASDIRWLIHEVLRYRRLIAALVSGNPSTEETAECGMIRSEEAANNLKFETLKKGISK